MVQTARDSVGASVTAISDSLRAALDSLPAQVADSIRTVLGWISVRLADTLRVGSPSEGWSIANRIGLVAVLIAVGSLLVSGYFSYLLWRLQKQQNAMVERHERERRHLESQIRAQQTRATDQQIGAAAFTLARQLTSWLDEPISGGLPGEVINEIRGATDPETAYIYALRDWAMERCSRPQSSDAERRADVLMDNAAAASESIRPRAVEAFRLFREALDELNKGIVYTAANEFSAAQQRFVNGHYVLRVCVLRLEDLIPEELHGLSVFLRDRHAVMHGHAPIVSGGPTPPQPDSGCRNISLAYWPRWWTKRDTRRGGPRTPPWSAEGVPRLNVAGPRFDAWRRA